MRNRGHVLDQGDGKTGSLQGTQCRLPTGPGALDANLDAAQAVFLGLGGGLCFGAALLGFD